MTRDLARPWLVALACALVRASSGHDSGCGAGRDPGTLVLFFGLPRADDALAAEGDGLTVHVAHGGRGTLNAALLASETAGELQADLSSRCQGWLDRTAAAAPLSGGGTSSTGFGDGDKGFWSTEKCVRGLWGQLQAVVNACASLDGSSAPPSAADGSDGDTHHDGGDGGGGGGDGSYDVTLTVNSPAAGATYFASKASGEVAAFVDVAFGEGPWSGLVRAAPAAFEICVDWDCRSWEARGSPPGDAKLMASVGGDPPGSGRPSGGPKTVAEAAEGVEKIKAVGAVAGDGAGPFLVACRNLVEPSSQLPNLRLSSLPFGKHVLIAWLRPIPGETQGCSVAPSPLQPDFHLC